ncbi:unnamed protein product [Hermetia illucens]|uniref:Uncharacterized protein n=1 Tax=Hermetia illucens TaxID=343691 RepID=A0A7R8UA93_HERIL|nr:unnamed protein product [Hermetia illucens]
MTRKFTILLLASAMNHMLCVQVKYVEQFLLNSSMFALFSDDSFESKDRSEDLLHAASTKYQISRLVLSKPNYGRIWPYVNSGLIAFVMISDENTSSILNVVGEALTSLLSTRTVFILNRFGTKEQVENVVKWCWDHRMINVLIIAKRLKHRFKVFTYNPFPVISIQEVPENTKFQDLFPDKTKNLQQFPIRTVRKYDFPRSYRYTTYGGKTVIGGHLAKIFYAWASIHNASVVIVDPESQVLDKRLAESYIEKDIIDIAPHFIGGSNTTNVTSTTPVTSGSICVVVPQAKPISQHLYLFLMFDEYVWILVIFAVLYISAVKAICNFCINKEFRFSEAACKAILSITNQPNNDKSLKCRALVLIHWQAMILGFVVTNMYLAHLSSILTTTIYRPQMNTYEDIERHGVRIMCEEQSFKLFKSMGRIPELWEHLFYLVDVNTFTKHVYSLNNSWGYVLTADKYEIMSLIEKLFKKPLFHKTRITIVDSSLGLNIRNDSVALNSLNKFLLDIFANGLRRKWMRDIIPEGIEGGLIADIKVIEDEFVPLTIEHLKLAWLCLVVGCFTAFLSFLVESFSKEIIDLLLHARWKQFFVNICVSIYHRICFNKKK